MSRLGARSVVKRINVLLRPCVKLLLILLISLLSLIALGLTIGLAVGLTVGLGGPAASTSTVSVSSLLANMPPSRTPTPTPAGRRPHAPRLSHSPPKGLSRAAALLDVRTWAFSSTDQL